MSKNNQSRYLGEYELDEKAITGEVIKDKDEGSIVLFLTDSEEKFGRHYEKLPLINGILNTGHNITLYNNECVKNNTQLFSYQNIAFRAQYAIMSGVPIGDKRFDRFRCVMENALDWSGISVVSHDEWNCLKIGEIEGKTFDMGDYRLTFETEVKQNQIDEVNRIEERLCFEIEFEEKKEVPFIIDLRNKIISMIVFGKQDNINIKNQILFDSEDVIGETKSCRPFHLLSNEPRRNIYDTSFVFYNYHLNDIALNEKAEELEKLYPVFNLANALLKYNDMPVEMLFLNIIQAVETFHARFYGEMTNELNDRVNNKFPEKDEFVFVRDLLLFEGDNRRVPLRKRLYELLIGDYDGLFCDYYLDNGKFVNYLVDSRNYYTHYNPELEEKTLKGDVLIKSIKVLGCLLDYYVCDVLGVDLEKQTRNYLSRL